MSFIRQQERAERAGRRLRWLHAVAVVATVAAFDALAALCWWLAFGADAFPSHFLATNTLLAGGLIVGGTWIESSRLAAGGQALAARLRARPVDAAADPLHRRLENVAAEAAIAARAPVPDLWVLEAESSIDAMTAAAGRRDAAIFVTRGALERLSRDELQALLAHEIAHVVNGDARLNTRVLASIYGLELTTSFGRAVLRRAFGDGRDARASPLAWPLAIPALALLLAGSAGVLAARALQSAVGRQREFAADAFAMRLVRQRHGLVGVLRRTVLDRAAAARRTPEAGAADPAAREAAAVAAAWAHLRFAPASDGGWFRRFVTGAAIQPSLGERLQRVLARDGSDAYAFAGPTTGGVAPSGAGAGVTEPELPMLDALAPERGVEVAAASGTLLRATRDRNGCAALALLLVQERPVAALEWPSGWRAAEADYPALRAAAIALPASAFASLRAPLLELASVRLRRALPAERELLLQRARALIEADRRVTLTEWIRFSLLRLRIADGHDGAGARAGRRHASACPPPAAVKTLVALVGRCAGLSEARIERAANAIVRRLGLAPVGALPERPSLPAVHAAIVTLAALAPRKRAMLVLLLSALTGPRPPQAAAEFIRMLCAAVDCPLPRSLRDSRRPRPAEPRQGSERSPVTAETAATI